MHSPTLRRAFATVLALVLAVESVSAVAAAADRHLARRDGGAGAPAAAAPAFTGPAIGWAPALGASAAVAAASVRSSVALAAAPSTPVAAPLRPAARVVPQPKVRAAVGPAPTGGSRASYSGRNHVWIPALGVNRSVSAFPCSRSRPPGNLVYRWGCAGGNNVYLFGHASSVFRGLHDAYVDGTLRRGLRVWYADGSGRVRAYAVRWWKVVRPTTDAAWAWASLATPSMTLQTCVGRSSEYRLMVRLAEVPG